MGDQQRDPFGGNVTRRTFVKGSGAGFVALLGGSLYATAPAAARARSVAKVETPLETIVISCRRTGRSTTTSATRRRSRRPASARRRATRSPTPTANPHRAVRVHRAPRRRTRRTTGARSTTSGTAARWTASTELAAALGDGNAAMGYYTAAELPFYYSLLDNSALVANYFCSLLGPTWPNRFYFAAGTSGGITTNGVWGYGVFDYPIILDLLDAAGVTWGVYNVSWDSVPFGNTDNVFVFWKKYAHDKRTRGSKGAFLNDARQRPAAAGVVAHPELRARLGRAPAGGRHGRDGPPGGADHGGARVAAVGQLRVHAHLRRARRLLRPCGAAAGRRVRARDPRADLGRLALREEGPIATACRASHVDAEAARGAARAADARVAEPPVRRGTPTGGNYEADGAPAPPRDGREDIGDLLDCFDF